MGVMANSIRGDKMKKQMFIYVLLGLIIRSSFGMNYSLTAREELSKAAQATNRYDIKNCCNEEDRSLCLNLYCGQATENEKDLSCLKVCWQRSKRNCCEKRKSGWCGGFATGLVSSSCLCTALWTAIIGITKVFP